MRDKMDTLRRLTVLGDPHVDEERTRFACTGCGACSDFCRHHIEVAPILFDGRAQLAERGDQHPALTDFPARFARHAAAAAQKAHAAVRETNAPAPSIVADANERIAVLAPCDQPHLGNVALELLAHVGVVDAQLAPEPIGCAGYPLLAAGERDAFKLHAERVAMTLGGFERVLVHCPACAHAMQNEYPRFGVPLAITVEHTTTYFARAGLQPKKRVAEAAYYQDPCYLGRRMGVYEEPRQLLAAAVDEVIEFPKNRAAAECSGGGGLLPVTMPDVASEIASRRLRSADKARTNLVATACGSCQKRLNRDGFATKDVMELLLDAMQR